MVGTWEQQDWYAPGSRRKVAVSVARALSPIVASPASTAFVWTISSVRNGKQCSSNQELHGCANVSQSKPCQPQQRDTEKFFANDFSARIHSFALILHLHLCQPTPERYYTTCVAVPQTPLSVRMWTLLDCPCFQVRSRGSQP